MKRIYKTIENNGIKIQRLLDSFEFGSSSGDDSNDSIYEFSNESIPGSLTVTDNFGGEDDDTTQANFDVTSTVLNLGIPESIQESLENYEAELVHPPTTLELPPREHRPDCNDNDSHTELWNLTFTQPVSLEELDELPLDELLTDCNDNDSHSHTELWNLTFTQPVSLEELDKPPLDELLTDSNDNDSHTESNGFNELHTPTSDPKLMDILRQYEDGEFEELSCITSRASDISEEVLVLPVENNIHQVPATNGSGSNQCEYVDFEYCRICKNVLGAAYNRLSDGKESMVDVAKRLLKHFFTSQELNNNTLSGKCGKILNPRKVFTLLRLLLVLKCLRANNILPPEILNQFGRPINNLNLQEICLVKVQVFEQYKNQAKTLKQGSCCTAKLQNTVAERIVVYNQGNSQSDEVSISVETMALAFVKAYFTMYMPKRKKPKEIMTSTDKEVAIAIAKVFFLAIMGSDAHKKTTKEQDPTKHSIIYELTAWVLKNVRSHPTRFTMLDNGFEVSLDKELQKCIWDKVFIQFRNQRNQKRRKTKGTKK